MNFNGRRLSTALLALAVGVPQTVSAITYTTDDPCSTAWGMNIIGWSHPAVRLDGNTVRAYTETTISGGHDYWFDNSPYWDPYIQSWMYRDGSQIGSNAAYTTGFGHATATQTYTPTLQTYGPGAYQVTGKHWMYAASCGVRWAGGTEQQSQTWGESLTVQRPTRPDYASFPGNTRYVTFLGNGISYSGNYSAQTVLVSGNPNGATETPQWVFKWGSGFGSLNCTSCTQPLFTAQRKGSYCGSYDVVLVTTYNGFESDPFYMFINGPQNSIMARDPLTNELWNETPETWGNGWSVRFNYNTLSMCALDAPMAGYDMNEQFESWVDDYYQSTGQHTSWNPPPCAMNPNAQNCGFPVPYAGWYDTLGFQCPGGNCTPMPQNPGSAFTEVQHALQRWRVGSGTPGQGIQIQTNLHGRYTDEGWHYDLESPGQ